MYEYFSCQSLPIVQILQITFKPKKQFWISNPNEQMLFCHPARLQLLHVPVSVQFLTELQKAGFNPAQEKFLLHPVSLQGRVHWERSIIFILLFPAAETVLYLQ